MAKVESRQIDGRMTVAALLGRWPGLAQAFRRHGMSCPGCAMSRFDALDYVAQAYGLGRARWLSELRRSVRRRAGARRAPRKVPPRSRGRRVSESQSADRVGVAAPAAMRRRALVRVARSRDTAD
jgi:hypothetical protein